MSLSSQQYANLTAHAYGEEVNGKKGQMKHLVGKDVTFEGVTYRVLEYMDRPSGYQGAIYQRMDTGEIVVVHRGSEFDREPFKDGLITDGGMVAARTNNQVADAIELTRRALEWSERLAPKYNHPLEVTVAGHSLGGALTQITAYQFHLYGETFNAFGAASLGYKIPEGGNQVINHVMATDLVSASGKHFGQVRMYASEQEVLVVGGLSGYDNDRDLLDVRNQDLAVTLSLSAHRMHHFTNFDGNDRPDQSILADPNAQRLAQEYRPMFDRYRSDLYTARAALSVASSAALDLHLDSQQAGGRLAANALDLSGDAVRQTTHAGAQVSGAASRAIGVAAATGLHQVGERVADLREVAGRMEAEIDRLQGQAQQQGNAAAADMLRGLSSLLPGDQPWLDTQARRLDSAGEQAYQRSENEAAQAQRDSLHDAAAISATTRIVELQVVEVSARTADHQHATIAGVGQQVDRSLDTAGNVIQEVTRRMPTPDLDEMGQKPSRDQQRQAPAHVPTPPPVKSESSPLELGTHGPQVQALQTHLHELGYRDARGHALSTSGVFDGHTRQAVIQFQEDKGLSLTGIADEATQRIAQASALEQQRQTLQAHQPRGRETGGEHSAQASQPDDSIVQTSPDSQSQTPNVVPFSDSRHRHHKLYAQAQEQTQAAGYDFSEARLTQITEALVKGDFGTKGRPWELQMHSDGKRLCFNDPNTVTGGRAMVDVTLPEPSIAAVVGKVDAADQRTMALMQEWQQQRAAQAQQGPVLG